MVSLAQTLIFSWVLLETYQSFVSATSNSSSDSSSSSYSFASPTCPIGFLPIGQKSPPSPCQGGDCQKGKKIVIKAKETSEEVEEKAGDLNLTQAMQTTISTANVSAINSTSPISLELRNEEEEEEEEVIFLSSLPPNTQTGALEENSSGISSIWLSSVPPSGTSVTELTTETMTEASTTNSSRVGSGITCAAPGQGVLWALVFFSAIYSFVGGLLIVAILSNVSWQLSIWFFYTVAYDLFMLIVAVIDGVYTSFSDISSYVVCLVTTYCVIVVDSYYEKLLSDERLEKQGGGGARRRSSLVIVRNSPDSPTSEQNIPPTSYTLPPASRTLAPPPISLGPPPGSRHGYHPAPSSPSKEPVQARHHHHHAYQNNV